MLNFRVLPVLATKHLPRQWLLVAGDSCAAPWDLFEMQTVAVASYCSYFRVRSEIWFDLNICRCVVGYSESCYWRKGGCAKGAALNSFESGPKLCVLNAFNFRIYPSQNYLCNLTYKFLLGALKRFWVGDSCGMWFQRADSPSCWWISGANFLFLVQIPWRENTNLWEWDWNPLMEFQGRGEGRENRFLNPRTLS